MPCRLSRYSTHFILSLNQAEQDNLLQLHAVIDTRIHLDGWTNEGTPLGIYTQYSSGDAAATYIWSMDPRGLYKFLIHCVRQNHYSIIYYNAQSH